MKADAAGEAPAAGLPSWSSGTRADCTVYVSPPGIGGRFSSRRTSLRHIQPFCSAVLYQAPPCAVSAQQAFNSKLGEVLVGIEVADQAAGNFLLDVDQQRAKVAGSAGSASTTIRLLVHVRSGRSSICSFRVHRDPLILQAGLGHHDLAGVSGAHERGEACAQLLALCGLEVVSLLRMPDACMPWAKTFAAASSAAIAEPKISRPVVTGSIPLTPSKPNARMCIRFFSGISRTWPFSLYLYCKRPLSWRFTVMCWGNSGTRATTRWPIIFFSTKAFPRRHRLATTSSMKRCGVISALGTRQSNRYSGWSLLARAIHPASADRNAVATSKPTQTAADAGPHGGELQRLVYACLPLAEVPNHSCQNEPSADRDAEPVQ